MIKSLTQIMGYLLNLVYMRGKFLTKTAASALSQAVKKCILLKRELEREYNKAIGSMFEFENMLEVINNQAKEFPNEIEENNNKLFEEDISKSTIVEKKKSYILTNGENKDVMFTKYILNYVQQLRKTQDQNKKQQLNSQLIENMNGILKTQELLVKNLEKLLDHLEKNSPTKNNSQIKSIRNQIVHFKSMTNINSNISNNLITEIVDEEVTTCRLNSNKMHTTQSIEDIRQKPLTKTVSESTFPTRPLLKIAPTKLFYKMDRYSGDRTHKLANPKMNKSEEKLYKPPLKETNKLMERFNKLMETKQNWMEKGCRPMEENSKLVERMSKSENGSQSMEESKIFIEIIKVAEKNDSRLIIKDFKSKENDKILLEKITKFMEKDKSIEKSSQFMDKLNKLKNKTNLQLENKNTLMETNNKATELNQLLEVISKPSENTNKSLENVYKPTRVRSKSREKLTKKITRPTIKLSKPSETNLKITEKTVLTIQREQIETVNKFMYKSIEKMGKNQRYNQLKVELGKTLLDRFNKTIREKNSLKDENIIKSIEKNKLTEEITSLKEELENVRKELKEGNSKIVSSLKIKLDKNNTEDNKSPNSDKPKKNPITIDKTNEEFFKVPSKIHKMPPAKIDKTRLEIHRNLSEVLLKNEEHFRNFEESVRNLLIKRKLKSIEPDIINKCRFGRISRSRFLNMEHKMLIRASISDSNLKKLPEKLQVSKSKTYKLLMEKSEDEFLKFGTKLKQFKNKKTFDSIDYKKIKSMESEFLKLKEKPKNHVNLQEMYEKNKRNLKKKQKEIQKINVEKLKHKLKSKTKSDNDFFRTLQTLEQKALSHELQFPSTKRHEEPSKRNNQTVINESIDYYKIRKANNDKLQEIFLRNKLTNKETEKQEKTNDERLENLLEKQENVETGEKHELVDTEKVMKINEQVFQEFESLLKTVRLVKPKSESDLIKSNHTFSLKNSGHDSELMKRMCIMDKNNKKHLSTILQAQNYSFIDCNKSKTEATFVKENYDLKNIGNDFKRWYANRGLKTKPISKETSKFIKLVRDKPNKTDAGNLEVNEEIT